jgi:hypothetical protein
MTMESRQPEGAESGSGPVRSATPSPADLWHEILARLNEVQEGQLRLARAIESLGMIVSDSLSISSQAALGDGATTLSRRTGGRVSLAAGPQTQANPETSGADAEDPAVTQRKIDSLLGTDVFVLSSPTPDTAAKESVASPRFYVAPASDENGKATRESVSSGSWPQGRRVARGLAREAPTMTTPSVVPNLTPSAIDGLLAAEVSDTSTRSTPPLRVVPAADNGAVLNTLLGAEFGAAKPVPTSTPPQVSAPAPAPAPAPAQTQNLRQTPPPTPSSTPGPSPRLRQTPGSPPTQPATSGASPVRPSPTPRSPLPTPGVPSSRPPASNGPMPSPRTPRQTVPGAPSGSPAAQPQVTRVPTASAPTPPDQRRSVGSPTPGGPPSMPAPVAPRPNPVSTPSPLIPHPVAPPAPTPGRAIPASSFDGPVGVRPTVAPDPPVGAPAPVEPRRSPLGPVTGNPAPFMSPAASTPESAAQSGPEVKERSAPLREDVENATQTTAPGESAASMVTEILSASPHTAEPDREESNKPAMLADDVTIMAKGRRRRFHLR